MGALFTPPTWAPPRSSPVHGGITAAHQISGRNLTFPKVYKDVSANKGRRLRIVKVAALEDPAQAVPTWQIITGTLAGVTPFVVAGIEFSKRIVAQRSCVVCKGSGLVLRDKKYYFRCPKCGGFLPWQSWKRFFSG